MYQVGHSTNVHSVNARSNYKVGHKIRCSSPDDMVETMEKLEHDGYETDFDYGKNPSRPEYWVVITKVWKEQVDESDTDNL